MWFVCSSFLSQNCMRAGVHIVRHLAAMSLPYKHVSNLPSIVVAASGLSDRGPLIRPPSAITITEGIGLLNWRGLAPDLGVSILLAVGALDLAPCSTISYELDSVNQR